MRRIDQGVMGLPQHPAPSAGMQAVTSALTPTTKNPVGPEFQNHLSSSSEQNKQIFEQLKQVSQQSGISLNYLMAQAVVESGATPDAHNRLSSATGLFQFTQATWLSVIKNHGAAHGLAEVAHHIQADGKGGLTISNPALYKHVMALRDDSALSTQMAAEFAKDNKVELEKSLGRPTTDTDLFMAHFFGASGASKLLKAHAHDPSQSAAALFPKAASHNRSIFYTADHKPRSVGAVYDRIASIIAKPTQNYAAIMDTHARMVDTSKTAAPAKVAAYAPISRIGQTVATPEETIETVPNPTALADMKTTLERTQAYALAARLVDFIATR